MKMEKINDYQIKFLLSKQDLKDRNITFGDLFQNSDKLQSLVREIMKLASERINFNVNDNPVMVEARPHPDGIVLVVSRAPAKDDAILSSEYKRHLEELYDGLMHFQRFGTDFSDNTDDKKDSVVIDDSVTSFVFCFDQLKKLIEACRVCKNIYDGQSMLYKLKDNYYLVLKYRRDVNASSAVNCLCEYGEIKTRISGNTNILLEYGEVLIPENAVEHLAEC